MNDLTKFHQHELTLSNAEVEQLERNNREICNVHNDLFALAYDCGHRDCRVDAMKVLVARAEAVQAMDRAWLSRSSEIASRRATKNEIATQLGMLVASFPNGGRHDISLYGRMLVEEITHDAPSWLALQRACRTLRRTSKFLPSISEVIVAIGCEQKKVFNPESYIAQLPALVAKISNLIESERKYSEIERQRRVYHSERTTLVTVPQVKA